MSVDTFDPSDFNTNAGKKPIAADLLAQSVELAGSAAPSDFEVALSQDQINALAPLLQHPSWQDAAADLDDAEIVSLVRFFTLGEMRYQAWKAEAKSPVVALVRVLKKRKAVPVDLVVWIKANTSNRFLPHGDLMDLL
jgi:hypothetical protein